MKLLRWRTLWPVLVLVLISVSIFLNNLHPGKYFLGWDSTTPELNFSLNFSRIIFGVWQEYRGLGTLDGMAHTANIVHWLVVRLLAVVLPVTDVRYVFQLLAHLMGGIGAYLLIRDFVTTQLHEKKHARVLPQLLALLGAVFYLLNFYTIQMFYLPLELFSVHYALFPWGLWSLLQYFQHGRRRDLLTLLLVNVLGMSQAHVPTVVIPYVVVLAVFSLHLLLTRLRSRETLAKVAIAALVIFAANALWGLPYLYSVATKTAEISQSKQNRLGTAGIFSRNYARSDLYSVATLGGFGLDYNDWSLDSEEFVSVMEPWESWYRSPIYVSLALGFFGLSLWGVASAIRLAVKEKQIAWWPYIISWLFALSMVGTKIPLLGGLAALLRNNVPLFGQIFRFTFTKFSIYYVLFQSVFLVVGAYFFLRWLGRRRWLFLPKKFFQASVLTVFIAASALLARPAFQGHFFYESLFVNVPDQYFSLFAYLNTHLPSARIVNMPINSMWGWLTNTRQWGYRGSGFTWQAIRQPVVDRSFDPWSKTNETLFLQLNNALYAQNTKQFLDTLHKFHANYLLVDRSIFHPGNYDDALFYEETDLFFSELPAVNQVQRFGQLELYRVDGTASKELAAPVVATSLKNYQATYTTTDAAFAQFGDYFDSNEGLIYPFASLQQENVSAPELTSKDLRFNVTNSEQKVTLPAFSAVQPAVPAVISQHKNALPLNSPRVTLTVDLQIPEVRFKTDKVLPTQTSWDLSLPNLGRDYFLSINNQVTKTGLFGSELPTKQHVSFSTRSDNTLLAFDTEIAAVRDVTENYLARAGQACVLGQGNFTKLVSVPVPAPAAVGVNGNDPALLTVAADFHAADGLIANACIRDVSTGQCVNEGLERGASGRPDWQTILTAAPLLPDKEYAVDLLGCEYREGVWSNIDYEAVWLQYYPFAGEQNIPTAAVFQQYDQDLLSANDTKVSQSETVIHVPLGGNQEFVLNSAGQKQLQQGTESNCGVDGRGRVEKRLVNGGVEYIADNGAVICDSYLFSEIDESLQYLFHAGGKNTAGAGLKFFLLNPENKHFDLETVSGAGVFDFWQTVYPTTNKYFPDEGFFTLSVNGETFGREKNITQLESLEFYPLPLKWLAQITVGDVDQATRHFEAEIISQKQWNPTLYTVRLKVNSDQGLLVLPQSFDNGWLLLGKKSTHVIYNGWANAWLLPQGEYGVVLLYWPQLLSFLGYGLLAGVLIWLIRKRA